MIDLDDAFERVKAFMNDPDVAPFLAKNQTLEAQEKMLAELQADREEMRWVIALAVRVGVDLVNELDKAGVPCIGEAANYTLRAGWLFGHSYGLLKRTTEALGND